MTVAIFILFFISGFTGLVYEVVWMRLFGLNFGNTTLAVSTVLASYMAGLALGSLVLGKVADRFKNPLRLFGFLELGIAIAAGFGLLPYGRGSALPPCSSTIARPSASPVSI